MKPQLKSTALSVALATIASSTMVSGASAGAPRFLDARAFAMGGVGAASARPAAASFYNPALLAIQHKEKANDFGLLLPSIMVQASDKEELIEKVDDFDDDFLKPFETSLNSLESANFSSVAEARAAGQDFVSKSRALQGELLDIDEDGVVVDAGAGFTIKVPSQSVAVGLFASGAARLATQANYEDNTLIDGYISQVETILNSNPANIVNDLQNLDINYDPNSSLESNVRVVGAAQSQIGLSFATSFEVAGNDIAVGLSPKMVNLLAYDYTSQVDDFEFDDVEDSESDDAAFNFDLGLAGYLDRDKQWLAGLSFINIIPQELKTNPVSNGTLPEVLTIELEPTVLAGISYSGESFTIAADVELTEKKALFNEEDTQYVGLGAEYDLFETMQFRLGARHNMAGSDDPYFTAGLGFTILGASLEVAGLSSADANTLGASVQLGATF